MTIHISNMDVRYTYIYIYIYIYREREREREAKRVECVDIIGFLAFGLGTRKFDIDFD